MPDNQAFHYGVNAYALQFHLETTPEMIREWTHLYREELEAEGIGPDVVTPPGLEHRCSRLRQGAERLLSNFLRLAG